MTEFRDVCEAAAQSGGRILQEMRGQVHPQEKAPKDLVTEADFASQAAIRDVIARTYPDHAFVGEEDGPIAAKLKPGQEYCWVVDPLDGTLNYTRQLPNYSVSVALCRGDRVICGVVYDPVLDECFSAEQGAGATLNGSPIQTSTCQEVAAALVAASLPPEIPRDSAEVARFMEIMYQSQAIRRLGSAALNLCYVAMGRLDAYWATCVKVWDVAAGQLIAAEAGATITRPDGAPFDLNRPQFVAGATERLQQELLALLLRAHPIEAPRH